MVVLTVVILYLYRENSVPHLIVVFQTLYCEFSVALENWKVIYDPKNASHITFLTITVGLEMYRNFLVYRVQHYKCFIYFYINENSVSTAQNRTQPQSSLTATYELFTSAYSFRAVSHIVTFSNLVLVLHTSFRLQLLWFIW